MSAMPQHMQALKQANEIRLRRADLHREVAALNRPEGSERLAELILDPPVEMETLAVGIALCWIWRVGPDEAGRILRVANVSYGRAIGAMTGRQRECLAARLRGEA